MQDSTDREGLLHATKAVDTLAYNKALGQQLSAQAGSALTKMGTSSDGTLSNLALETLKMVRESKSHAS